MDPKHIKSSDTLSGAVVLAFVGILVLNLLHIKIPLSMTTSMQSSELAVVGEGKVDIAPDTAFVDLGITVSGVATVQEAQASIDKVNNAVIDAVKQLGITKENVKTTNYSINPNYTYEGGKDRINGYNGNATITVKTSKTDLTPKIIEVATAAGANQVQGARFSVEKPETYRTKARNEAIANAKAQAKQLAADLGIKLGKVTNIIESNGMDGGPIAYDMAKAYPAMGLGGGGGGPAIEPGTQTISSVVTLYFEKN